MHFLKRDKNGEIRVFNKRKIVIAIYFVILTVVFAASSFSANFFVVLCSSFALIFSILLAFFLEYINKKYKS